MNERTQQSRYAWLMTLAMTLLIAAVGTLFMHLLNRMAADQERTEGRVGSAETRLEDALGLIRYNEATLERFKELRGETQARLHEIESTLALQRQRGEGALSTEEGKRLSVLFYDLNDQLRQLRQRLDAK